MKVTPLEYIVTRRELDKDKDEEDEKAQEEISVRLTGKGGLLQQFQARPINTHPAGLPQRPVDRPRAAVPLFRGHLLIAICCKLVHETIRGRIIGLPQIP